MKNLIAHATDLNLTSLTEVLQQAFDPELRNGYAHGDYIIYDGEIRLRRRYKGGLPRTVNQEEFLLALNKAIVFFESRWRQPEPVHRCLCATHRGDGQPKRQRTPQSDYHCL